MGRSSQLQMAKCTSIVRNDRWVLLQSQKASFPRKTAGRKETAAHPNAMQGFNYSWENKYTVKKKLSGELKQ